MYNIITTIFLGICKKHVPHKKRPRKHQMPSDKRATMRERSKVQKKIQNETNQSKLNALNQVEVIQNDLKIPINTE